MKQDWISDFNSFLTSNATPPPDSLSQPILMAVRADLNPSLPSVFGKLTVVHVLVGLFTISFCPQLGVGPFIAEVGLMPFFMRFGSVACAVLCGSLFLGTSMLIGALLLRAPELRLARKYRFVNGSLLAAVSLACLMVLGSAGGAIEYLSWLIGASVGGWLALEAVASLRIVQT